MRANRAYRLIVTPGGHEPRFLAERGRRDRIEVVSIDDGELLLYWDLPAREAAPLVRELREALIALSPEEFLALWEGADGR
jgi:hypothetical protein